MTKQRSRREATPVPAADDDAGAFRAAVRDVKPLPQTAAAAAPTGPQARARRRRLPPVPESPALDLPSLVNPADSPLTGGDPLSFRRPGVRDQVVRRLRRGLFPIDDELDLHGLSQSAARDELAQFLAFNRAAGRRCVRVIHGKGYRSGARGPVLKIAVDAWLRRHTDVMAFTSARGIDGGTGAVYVLLRA